ncbi:uncharacterized protein LOC112531456 isoform X4 [Gallus gallus]|uniref:uncharacterized protein LOC112531456 isoform X4 n=1 Tax=Gallus gallus TaxID=9031 RepID=UPI000D63E694|nr:uncharacterized protein LOC112531456 isoform X4 [Gallus gallus]|eukprot:XP_025002335.1 uncharacterized protein LOC112531456 isoform X1 [Gallus gallus]
MGPYGSLWVAMGPYVSLCVPMGPYVSLWVPMGAMCPAGAVGGAAPSAGAVGAPRAAPGSVGRSVGRSHVGGGAAALHPPAAPRRLRGTDPRGSRPPEALRSCSGAVVAAVVALMAIVASRSVMAAVTFSLALGLALLYAYDAFGTIRTRLAPPHDPQLNGT